jgi:hypothetical protein
MKEAVHTPDISAKLNIAILQLDVESMAELWLILQLKHDQWDGIAKGLNTLMPEGEKFKGGMLPRTERLLAYLKERGGRLNAEDVEEVSNLLVEDDEASVVDVVSSDDDSALIDVDLQNGFRQQATLESHSHHTSSRAYFVRNVMQRCIAPEMLAMQDAYPGIVQHWAKHGMDIVVAADGTAVVRFCFRYIKLEVSTAKIIIPSLMGG